MSHSTETFTFKSEARQLLDLMINSLYSNKEIFLRELISNSSDALDKLRFEALTQPDLLDTDEELSVRIEMEDEPRILTISDNGIGMSRDEVIENLGTIARSGTREFTAQMAESQTEGAEGIDALIGQFGVGFYSAFMVADEVEVLTRRAGESTGTRWVSQGDDSFEVGDGDRETAGTTVILKLRNADPENGLPDFTQEWVVRQTVKSYSDFVQYPVQLFVERSHTPEAEGDETPEPVVTRDWETVNSMKAIWSRRPAEVTEEEYAEFYKHISHDWEAPQETVHFKAEGAVAYESLVFIPGRPPMDMFYRDQQFGLQLYVNRVLIKERAEELLPIWLRFVRGVVDSPDLPLNVSREILQNDRRVSSIKKRIGNKVLGALAKLQKDDAEKYGTFWANFGRVIKEGVADPDFSEKVRDLLWFSTTAGSELASLATYVERMKEGQEAIYYITGASREAVEKSPHLEAFLDKGYEVLFLTDPVDELMVGHLTEYQEKKLQSVGKGDIELGSDEERKEAEEARKAKQETHASLLGLMQTSLEDHIKEVRLSARLTSSAACLVGEEYDMSPGLERMLNASGQEVEKQKRILEINPEHPILEKMQALFSRGDESETLEDYAHLLHGQALIAEGSTLPDPAAFARRVAELMVR